MNDGATSWARLEEIVDAALDVEPAARTPLVTARCGDDAALREAALAWLEGCEHEAAVLDAPPPMSDLLAALEALAPDAVLAQADDDGLETDRPPLSRVGPWQLLEQIGRGGMGTVHLALRDDVELPMRAAVKLLHGAAASHPASVRRFREERRILAALEHPAIARLMDGGVTEQGLPWFAMEYVAGAPIDEWCDRRALPVAARLRLFAQVCDAVQHAHTHLVVHRDLKPGNVLVSDDGAVKLLDFGIAKLLAPDLTSSESPLTTPGIQPMTRAFAAPEQVRGEPASTATDVYALGVLLHVLLSGHLPVPAGSELAPFQQWPPGELVRPSAAVRRTRLTGSGPRDAELPTRVAAARSSSPARLHRQLCGDLDTIVGHAMQLEPARRYATAHEFAADVRRHLDGLPVLARPTSVAYRLGKLVRRSPVGAAATVAATVVLIGFTAVTATQAAQLRIQAARVAAERDKATEVTAFLTGLLSSADPYQPDRRPPTLREVLDRGAERAASLEGQPELQAHLLSAMAPAYFGLGDGERAGALAEEAVALWRRALPSDHPDIGAALLYLANVRLNHGRADEAQAQAREALRIHRAAAARGVSGLGDSARILSTLGAALQRSGRLAEAEAVLRSLLAAERARSPAAPEAVAQVARNLAHVLRDARRHAEAAPLYDEAYAMHRAAFGEEHPETANSAVNLGVARTRLGDLVEGERLVRHGVTVKRRLLGITHPDVAGDQLTLARLIAGRGGDAEAGRLRVEAEAVLARANPGGR